MRHERALPSCCSRPTYKTCVDAGDALGLQQVRAYAAAGLSDAGILRRILARLGLAPADVIEIEGDPRHDDAAWSVARHLATCGEPEHRIIEVLVMLAVEVPGSVTDEDELAFIARAAIREVGC